MNDWIELLLASRMLEEGRFCEKHGILIRSDTEPIFHRVVDHLLHSIPASNYIDDRMLHNNTIKVLDERSDLWFFVSTGNENTMVLPPWLRVTYNSRYLNILWIGHCPLHSRFLVTYYIRRHWKLTITLYTSFNYLKGFISSKSEARLVCADIYNDHIGFFCTLNVITEFLRLVDDMVKYNEQIYFYW